MREIRVVLTSDDKEIEYHIDIEKSTYRSMSRKRFAEAEDYEEEIAEQGDLGDADRQQMIAKRIYYVLLASMKHGQK